MPSVPVTDEAHWHSLRARNIGSSDQAALWALSPHKTLFQLWHEKAGSLPPEDISGDLRVLFGRELERGIAHGIAKLHGLNIRKVRRYIAHDRVEGMGASLDYEVATDAGLVPMEVKNVDFLVWRDEWLHDGDEHEPPLHIDIQVQHQLACTNRPFAFVAVLVGGNDPYLIKRPAQPAILAACEERTAAFWASIAERREPSPDYTADLESLMRLRLDGAGGIAAMHGHARLEQLMAQYASGAGLCTEGEALKVSARAEALDLIGDAGKVLLDGGTISAKVRPAEPARMVQYKATDARRAALFFPRKQQAAA